MPTFETQRRRGRYQELDTESETETVSLFNLPHSLPVPSLLWNDRSTAFMSCTVGPQHKEIYLYTYMAVMRNKEFNKDHLYTTLMNNKKRIQTYL
jgi:hypothetical protein